MAGAKSMHHMTEAGEPSKNYIFKIEQNQRDRQIPQGGVSGGCMGGSHDAAGDECEDELVEAQGQASTCPRHARYVVHSSLRHRVLGLSMGLRRWRFYWVHRRASGVHHILLLIVQSSEQPRLTPLRFQTGRRDDRVYKRPPFSASCFLCLLVEGFKAI